MDHEIILPRMSQRAAYGRIVAWLKELGDRVEEGEAILITETDKAAIELRAEVAGTLAKIRSPAGLWVPLESSVGVIRTEAE